MGAHVTSELTRSAVIAPPARVEVERIETSLASMWSDAADPGKQGESPGVTRACTLNLIVYTTPDDDREQLDDVLAEINQEHPSRTLIMIADRKAAQARIEAYISMRCRLVGGTGKQVCGEEVTIEVDGPRVDAAASAVEALLVPGLPTYLWWKDIPHQTDMLFDRLTRMADRIVIDSAKFDHATDDLRRLASLIGEPSSTKRVSDLNWGRLTAWCTLLAGLWDVPDYRPLLDRVDRLAIAYRPLPNGRRGMAPRPLMLAGWLASRLRWEVVEAMPEGDREDASWRLRSGQREIVLSLRRDTQSPLADARIASVELSSSDGSGGFVAALAPDNSRITTEARIGDVRSLARVLAYTSRNDADRLSGELAILRHDAVYEAAMRSAGQLIASCPRILDSN